MKKLVFTVVFVAFTLSGCIEQKEQDSAKNAQQSTPALPVQVYEIKDEASKVSKTFSAVLSAYEEVEVLARVGGVIEKKHFIEGSFVEKGSPLFTIEQKTYAANLQKAKADLEKATARLKKAQKDFQRAQSLIDSKAISAQQFDAYEFEYSDATAALAYAKAALITAQTNYDYTNVTAPISGVAGMKNFNVGDLVGTAATNTHLVTITATNPLYANFSLSKDDVASYIAQLRSGDVKVSLQSGTKTYANGTIDFIAPTIDTKTDTLALRAKFENTGGELIAGQFAKIQIDEITLANVHIIPENALVKTLNGNFVYVVSQGVANLRPVQTGELTPQGVVVLSGLNSGDAIVVSNIAKLRPETKVQIIGKE